MHKLSLIFLFTLSFFHSYAQSGPAGVGSSSTNVLWLKADAGTSTSIDGSAITGWNDQSGNAIHVSQSNAAQAPAYKASLMNGMPAVEFDFNSVAGQNDYLTAADNTLLDNTAGYTAFSVVRMKTMSGNGQSILSKRTAVDADEAFMFFFHTGSSMYLDIDGLNNRLNTSNVYSINTNYLLGFTYDGTAASATRSKIMEGDSARKTAAELSAIVPDKASPLVIGSTHIGDVRAFGGYISEIILYRTVLNDAQRTIINNYLSAKYDIALLKNDKYAGDNTSNDNFDRDVAGIGQEANGNSNSFDATATKGLKITATAGFDNGDYIFAGHRYPVNGANTTDVGGMTGANNVRWERNWYIDVTNSSTALTTDLEFDFSDAGLNGLPSGSPSGYVLLYRPVNSGNWTEVAASTSITGDRIIFSGYTLQNDGYYTIGGQNYMTGTLAVSLQDFRAVQSENSVELHWETVSEQSNDFFTIERSADAIDYAEVAKIGSGAVNGNSNSQLDYNYTDMAPLDGMNYYRLRQTDTDGKMKVYAPVSLWFQKEKNDFFTLFPNPGNGIFTLNYNGVGNNQTISIAVIDLQGNKVYERSQRIDDAGGSIDVNPPEPLNSGVYTMQIRSESAFQTLKMMVE
jgi:hypothetical protein